MWTVITVITVCISSVIAPAPCSSYPNIPCLLKEFKECYKNGQPPCSLAGYNTLSTMRNVSADVLPTNTCCVTGLQKPGSAVVDVYYVNGSSASVAYLQVLKENYIEETDLRGIIYRIYIIHNYHHVYSYYRCIETEGEEGTGQVMYAIYVQCKYQDNWETQEQIKLAEKCAERLNITNMVAVKPCDC